MSTCVCPSAAQQGCPEAASWRRVRRVRQRRGARADEPPARGRAGDGKGNARVRRSSLLLQRLVARKRDGAVRRRYVAAVHSAHTRTCERRHALRGGEREPARQQQRRRGPRRHGGGWCLRRCDARPPTLWQLHAKDSGAESGERRAAQQCECGAVSKACDPWQSALFQGVQSCLESKRFRPTPRKRSKG